MNINPGELNKKIEIIEMVDVRNENGFSTQTENIVRTPWASFRRTTGKEKIESGKEMEIVEARFIVRASSVSITPKMIIRYNGELYDIKYINDYKDSKEYQEIWATLEV